MTCVVLTAVALVTFPGESRAEPTKVHLTVRPMSAPQPALKYQLLPEVSERNPGNAAQNYLKCFMEQRNFFYNKEAVADRARFQTLPLAELPLDKLKNYGGGALVQADWAARLDSLDWQTLQQIQSGGIEAIPGELGPLQALAAALKVRFRAEVAGRHFDDAIRTAKTMFALSRHLGEHPTEIGSLVGLWVAHLGLGTLEEMVQQPGCPNLYWALTDLPCPLVDLRTGMQGDRTLVAAELRLLNDVAPVPEAELEKFVSHLSGVLSFAREQAGQSPRSLRNSLQARVKDTKRVVVARRRLVAAGHAKDLVEKLSPLHVILLDDRRDFEIQRDERVKLLPLPLWQLDSFAGGENRKPDADGLFAELLPNIVKLRRTQGQLERQIVLLRLVEALRLHAADHEGKLPANLCDISVPLPVDPVTGKPFDYLVEGVTAHLRGGPLPGDLKNPESEVHYEVEIQK
jgi:hypothetical protein